MRECGMRIGNMDLVPDRWTDNKTAALYTCLNTMKHILRLPKLFYPIVGSMLPPHVHTNGTHMQAEKYNANWNSGS